MINYKVDFDQSARDDLAFMLTYIIERSGERRANSYLDRIMKFCDGFDRMPERFPIWNHLHPTLRIAVFERSVSIAFEIRDDSVLIIRVMARGQDRDAQLTKSTLT